MHITKKRLNRELEEMIEGGGKEANPGRREAGSSKPKRGGDT